MRIKYCLIILLILPFIKTLAQEDPKFVLAPWLQPFYNPGAVGEQENHINFIGLLNQYSMMMGEPNLNETNADPSNSSDNNNPTLDINEKNNKKKNLTKQDGQQVVIHIDSYIKKIKGAVGIVFIKDKNGYNDNIEFRLGYTTRLRVRSGKLGIGVQFGFLNQKVGKTGEWRPNQNDDPTIPKSEENSFMDFDMNVGLHYRAPTWYAGVSCSKIIGGARISGEKNVGQAPRQLYVTGGYIWNLKTAVPWSIEPGVLFRTNMSSWYLNFIAAARYNGILWFGLAYQTDHALSLFAGAVPFYNNTNEYLKRLELGVCYSFGTSKYAFKKNGSMGDFEILVRYGFNFYKDKALTGYGSSRHLYKNQY